MSTDLTLVDLALPEETTSDLSHDHAQLVAATLDARSPGAGDPLPLLWHWAYFNPTTPTAQLGVDGHPERSGEMLQRFPRRMWVGGDVRQLTPLRCGSIATRRTTLLSHDVKNGSTGDLLLVSLEHTIEQAGKVALVERQNVIYREAGSVTPAPGAPVDLGPETTDPLMWSETVVPNAALLFRFSAVTFNTHRIHFDYPYATEVEGYPDLVVHGPLTAMLLAASAARHIGRPLVSFTFRASSPLFVAQPVRIAGTIHEDSVAVTALRQDGTTAMSATAT